MNRNDDKSPYSRAKLADHVHFGLEKILHEQGFSEIAAQALLDFDAEMFRWRGMQSRGEFISLLLTEADAGIEPAGFMALSAVSRRMLGIDGAPPRPPTVGEVAEDMNLDPSRASRIISDLVDKGMLLRAADQADGRRSVLALQPKGIAVMEKFRDAKWRMLSKLFNTWRDDEISAFSVLLRKYLDGLSTLGRR